MAKLAIILPHDNLASAAALLLQEMHMEHVPIIHFSGNPEEIPYLVDWAKKQGAEIILTRGLIATRARRFSNISVVEMRSSAQELGLLIQKAKELIRKKDPVIALVGTANMFSDYSRLGELFGVTLLSYLIPQDNPDPYSSLEKLALQAIEDRADLVIGGNTACRTAQENSVPYLFLAATEESLREGLRLARRISY
ncbi:MAG: PrpR N-terminal domain-containing protein, partial [Eubacteriales bacterium]|nr:PrpR N-terminal domain-containing protein [Eubacteriales bacterium]